MQGDQVYAINRVSGRVVAEVGFRSPLTKNVSGAPSRSIGENRKALLVVDEFGVGMCRR